MCGSDSRPLLEAAPLEDQQAERHAEQMNYDQVEMNVPLPSHSHWQQQILLSDVSFVGLGVHIVLQKPDFFRSRSGVTP